MNFSIVFYLFTITNILIISSIRIGEAAGDDSDSEISELELQKNYIKKGKQPVSDEYECSSAQNVPSPTIEDIRLIDIWANFEDNVSKNIPTEFDWYTEQQKLDLCKRVWSAYMLKINSPSKTITKDQLENCEKCYNVKKIDDYVIQRINLNVGSNQDTGIFVLGCHLEEKYPVLGMSNNFNVFIKPHQNHTSYYLIRYDERHQFYCIIDLIDNIEIPQKNELSQSGFLGTMAKNFKTYLSFKKDVKK